MKNYIWEVQFQSPEQFRGLSVLYRDHRKVSGGPPGGATCPGGLNGLNKGGNQPIVGWCAPPRGPRSLGHQTLGFGGSPPPNLGGKPPPFPLGAPPPSRSNLEGLAPFPFHPINRGEEGGQQHHIQGAALPLSHISSSSVELGEALQENHELHHHAVVLPEFFPNFSSPPCWIKKEETSPRYTCVERGGTVVRCLDRNQPRSESL